jgi:RHS repeat-associated protein
LVSNFEINAFGLRDRKYANDGSETRFVYDLRGHLIAELDKNNVTTVEYIWFGNIPIMVRNVNAGVVSEFYIYSDNLNTPRRVVVPSSNLARWAWNSDAYGNGTPNGNPSGIGGYSFHLRFPGQFADSETGIYYNSSRNYNPVTGRYIEADPTGFDGGINPYVYADGSPISEIDPAGLVAHLNALNWANSTQTPDGEALYAWADSYRPDAYNTIVVHGTPDGGFSTGQNARGFSMGVDAYTLAQQLMNMPGYDPTKPVQLIACTAGGGDGKGAADLANYLGNNVLASPQILTSNALGKPPLAFGSNAPPRWFIFHPPHHY